MKPVLRWILEISNQQPMPQMGILCTRRFFVLFHIPGTPSYGSTRLFGGPDLGLYKHDLLVTLSTLQHITCERFGYFLRDLRA